MKYFIAQKAKIGSMEDPFARPYGLMMMIAESKIIAIEPWPFEGMVPTLLGFTQENHQMQGKLREGETGYILFDVISTAEPDFVDKAKKMVGA